MRKLLYILSVACILAACNDAKIDANYVITPYVQLLDKGPREPAQHVKAYAYYGDTTYWKVMSWEDAVNGLLTSKSDETRTKSPDFTAELDADGRLILGPLTQLNVMLLVCQTDPDAVGGVKMYAWRNANTIENLEQISVNLTFKPWWKDSRKRDGKWLFVSEHPPVEPPVPPTQPEV